MPRPFWQKTSYFQGSFGKEKLCGILLLFINGDDIEWNIYNIGWTTGQDMEKDVMLLQSECVFKKFPQQFVAR